jgi:hypothetical protein
MKELDILMEAIEKRGIPKKFSLAAKFAGYPKNAKNDEHAQEILNKAVRHAFVDVLHEDEELNNMFAEYAFELGMNELIKKLDIKVPEKGTESKAAEFLKKLIDEIFE